MQTTTPGSTSHGNWLKWRWSMWVLCAILSASLLGRKQILDRQYREYETRESNRLSAAAKAAAPLRRALQKLRNETIEEVQTQFIAQAPFTQKSMKDGYSRLDFSDARSGYSFSLWFHRGRFSYPQSRSIWPAQFDNEPSQTFGDIVVGAIRIGAILWVILLILCLNLPDHRHQLAEALSGVALFCIACLAAEYDLSRWLVIKAESTSLCIGVAMLLTSIVLIVLPPRRGYKHSNCKHCGYDLTGNQSGVCPECGNSTPRPSGDADEVALKLSLFQNPIDSAKG